MRNKNIYILLLTSIIIFQTSTTALAKEQKREMTCEERLRYLEPSEPKTIYDEELFIDRDLNRFKGKPIPISTVIKNGIEVPYVTILKDLNWERPIYSPFWHSTMWRWSRVPNNIGYQKHKVFAYLGGASVWYDLSHELALGEGFWQPSPISKDAFTVKYPYVVRLIIFDFNVKNVKRNENQIVVFGEPLRKGLTSIDFDTKEFGDEQKLIQLATPDGYELDYEIIF